MSDTEEEAGSSRPPRPTAAAAAAAAPALLAIAHTPHSIDEDSISSQDSCSDYNDNEENTDADVSDAHSSCSYAAATSSSTIPGSRGGVSRRRMPARIAKDNFNRISSAIMKPLKKKQRRELNTNAQTLKSIEKIYMNSQHMKKFRPSNLETIFEEPSDENAADAEDDSEEQGSTSISEQVRIVKFGSRKLRRAISFNDGLNKNKNLVKKRRLKVKKTFGKRLALKKISMTEFHDRLNKSLDSAMVDEEDEDEQEGQLLAFGGDAQNTLGLRAIGLRALGVANDLQINTFHPVGLVSRGGQAPAAGNSPSVVVHVVAIVEAGQLNLVNIRPEVDMGGTDQGDIIAILIGPVRVLDEVAAADSVGELGILLPGGTVEDGHSASAVCAMGSSQNPIVGNDGTTAPPSVMEVQTDGVGCLALVGWVAVDNATIDLVVGGHILGMDLLGHNGASGYCGQSQSQYNEHFHGE
ncbi:uncharacterized protein Dwil_GK16900 [Drosophila willistoni]|uniref:Tantalus-like domain-containing protein n=2 Tax=Drosophila willistoni TaxID=7260 RepID=B4MLM7_DROWI|nr:uncharacterized protein Dwil_GK16900 [Drosophila willistoni]